jgi:2-amino-4-hydroxy-6-hydroxymethyldihydropteridine diphosphokinase
MHNCFLLLGSNLGSREDILNLAECEISAKIGAIQRGSSVYETEAWGFTADQPFLNKVVELETELSATHVFKKILEIENKLGRVRNSKGYTSRFIDIDMLFFDDEIVDEPHLQIPHPLLHERMFTLVPLMEIASLKMHVGLQRTISELFDQCTDKLEVKKFIPKSEAFA